MADGAGGDAAADALADAPVDNQGNTATLRDAEETFKPVRERKLQGRAQKGQQQAADCCAYCTQRGS
jgi:hypothetical protein